MSGYLKVPLEFWRESGVSGRILFGEPQGKRKEKGYGWKGWKWCDRLCQSVFMGRVLTYFCLAAHGALGLFTRFMICK